MNTNDRKQETVDTYNKKAVALAQKFDSQGARVDDIDFAFSLLNKINPKVLEIGCGNGRDAAEILKKTNNYIGLDISEGLIALARQKVPAGQFEVVDITNYEFPTDIDIVFAFASLIHVQKDELATIFKKLYSALNTGGVIHLSMKYAENYIESTKEDQFGVRTYYLYSLEEIKELAEGFTVVKSDVHDLRDQIWMDVVLQKK